MFKRLHGFTGIKIPTPHSFSHDFRIVKGLASLSMCGFLLSFSFKVIYSYLQ